MRLETARVQNLPHAKGSLISLLIIQNSSHINYIKQFLHYQNYRIYQINRYNLNDKSKNIRKLQSSVLDCSISSTERYINYFIYNCQSQSNLEIILLYYTKNECSSKHVQVTDVALQTWLLKLFKNYSNNILYIFIYSFL